MVTQTETDNPHPYLEMLNGVPTAAILTMLHNFRQSNNQDMVNMIVTELNLRGEQVPPAVAGVPLAAGAAVAAVGAPAPAAASSLEAVVTEELRGRSGLGRRLVEGEEDVAAVKDAIGFKSVLSTSSAVAARTDLRFIMITCALSSTQASARVRPVPDVQPVIAITLPSCDGRLARNSGLHSGEWGLGRHVSEKAEN